MGYQENTPTNTSGAAMMAPTFLAISATTNCTLADLSVKGYPLPEQNPHSGRWSGGTSGAFNLQFLKPNGSLDKAFAWFDNGTKKGWYDDKGGVIPGGAESIEIVAGQAMWCANAKLTLVSAGQVNLMDVEYKTGGSGAVGLGNPFPVDMTLADLSVKGYPLPEQNPHSGRWSGGTSGAFNLQFLKPNGSLNKAYAWFDNGTKKGWFDDKGGVIPGGAESVKIPAGQGFWCAGATLTLVIPAPEIK